MYVSQTLRTINSELIDQFPNESSHPTEQHYERFSSFKVYSHCEDIEQLVSYGKALSVVFMSLNNNHRKFYVCQRSQNPKQCLLYEILFNEEYGFNKCGLWYAPIEICVINIGSEITKEEIDDGTEIYGIMCPCISDNIEFKNCYAVICSNWKYRGKNNIIALPDISMNLYNSIL